MLFITFLVFVWFFPRDTFGFFDEKGFSFIHRIDCKVSAPNAVVSNDLIFRCEESDNHFVARRSLLESSMKNGTLEKHFHRRGQQRLEWVKFRALLVNFEKKFLSSKSPCASFDSSTRGEVSEISTSSLSGTVDFKGDISMIEIGKAAASGTVQLLGSLTTENVCKGANGETAELQMVQLRLILSNITFTDAMFSNDEGEMFQRSIKIPLGSPIRRCVTDTRYLACHEM